jgi:hypothetical protein
LTPGTPWMYSPAMTFTRTNIRAALRRRSFDDAGLRHVRGRR